MEYGRVDAYIEGLGEPAKSWMGYFAGYMRKTHPELEGEIFHQMLLYRLEPTGKGNYIAFSASKRHLSMHTMDFGFVAFLKSRLNNPGGGRGCVNVSYSDVAGREVLTAGIEGILKRDRRRKRQKAVGSNRYFQNI